MEVLTVVLGETVGPSTSMRVSHVRAVASTVLSIT
jgi:hypothetical protein